MFLVQEFFGLVSHVRLDAIPEGSVYRLVDGRHQPCFVLWVRLIAVFQGNQSLQQAKAVKLQGSERDLDPLDLPGIFGRTLDRTLGRTLDRSLAS